MRIKFSALIFFLITILAIPMNVTAAPASHDSSRLKTDLKTDSVTFDFPNTATFSATLTANAPIVSIVLEYGNEQQTCGEVIAKAFPEFTPANTVNASWTWDMRQSGSLPPGASIWWRWRYIDENGNEQVSEIQTATWIDDIHNWQTVSESIIRLHYYGKDESFAQTMLDASLEGLRRNKEQAGLESDKPIDIYVYPNYNDMRDATLYEPSWTGGQAYSDFNIIIMGISGSDANWDKNTVIHELTHVLVGQFSFTCIGTVPTWLNEGLAMYSEGELDSGMQSLLNQAIQTNNLITLRSLNGAFSELSDKANLSYSQSHSVVKFLIETYGQEKMTQLLIALRDAKPIDTALIEVYGFDTDGLEDAWRKSVGAEPRTVAQATAQPTPTYVPTYIPISGVPLAVTPTPYTIPTSSFEENQTTQPQRTAPPLSLTIILLCLCLIFLLMIAIVILGFVVRSGNNKKDKTGGENG